MRRGGEIAEKIDKNDVVGIVGMIAFLGLIVCLIGLLVIWINGYAPSYSARVDSSSIALKGVPGHEVDLSLTGESLKHYWASDSGLTLTLNGSAFQLVKAKSNNWGESISCEMRSDECSYYPNNLTIDGSFTLPSSYVPGDRVSGTLTGDLLTPQGSIPGFVNQTQRLNIPVRVEVVKSLPSQYEAWGVCALIALAVLILSVAWFYSPWFVP